MESAAGLLGGDAAIAILIYYAKTLQKALGLHTNQLKVELFRRSLTKLYSSEVDVRGSWPEPAAASPPYLHSSFLPPAAFSSLSHKEE